MPSIGKPRQNFAQELNRVPKNQQAVPSVVVNGVSKTKEVMTKIQQGGGVADVLTIKYLGGPDCKVCGMLSNIGCVDNSVHKVFDINLTGKRRNTLIEISCVELEDVRIMKSTLGNILINSNVNRVSYPIDDNDSIVTVTDGIYYAEARAMPDKQDIPRILQGVKYSNFVSSFRKYRNEQNIISIKYLPISMLDIDIRDFPAPVAIVIKSLRVIDNVIGTHQLYVQGKVNMVRTHNIVANFKRQVNKRAV